MDNSYEQVREWGLVLDAEDIPYGSDYDPETGGWRLVVAPEQAERAAAVLRAWRRENRPEPEPTGEADWGWTPAGLVTALLLALGFVVSGPREAGARYFSRGAAVGIRILDGEWWRTVTALTLHADLGHILANSLFGALFFGEVARAFGPGLGLGLVLLSGMGGNALNAFLQFDGQSSVGASTAVFGAIGLLGGRQLVRRMARGQRGGRAWLPVSAALGLLILTGMGPETDVFAHVLGFVVGLPLGAAAAWLAPKPPPRLAQWALLAATAGLVAVSWWLALMAV